MTRAFINKLKKAARKIPAPNLEWVPFKRKRKRAAPQVEIAAKAVAAIFPDKKMPDELPSQATLPNPYLIRMVRKQLEKDGITRPIHDDSILRAAGRKRK